MGKNNEIKTILVIDDDSACRFAIEKNLKMAGYKVITANDGMEGLKLIESATYDMVITDIEMPFVSGVGVIMALKERHPDIPAFAITGYGEEPLRAAKEKTADVVLSKPLDVYALLENIGRVLAADFHAF